MLYLCQTVIKSSRDVSILIHRYVYDYLGGNHDNIWNELVATVCTFSVTALWLGPCQIVCVWAFLNCFGLNFEFWLAKFFLLEPFASIEVRQARKAV